MATTEYRENYQGALSNYHKAQARYIRLQAILQRKARENRARLEKELEAEMSEREGFIGDFRKDKELGPEYAERLKGLDDLAMQEAVYEINQSLATPDPNNPNRLPESIESITQNYQLAAKEAAPFITGEGTPTTKYTRSPEQRLADFAAQQEAREVARLQGASEAYKERQNVLAEREALRNKNVVDSARAAMAGGSDDIETFTRQIESISNPDLRAETIGLAEDAGFKFQRPIQLRGEAGVDPTQVSSVEYPSTQVEGGAGYWQRADGTFTVEAPDGSEYSLPTEDAAKQMMASFNQVEADSAASPERIAEVQRAAEDVGYVPSVAPSGVATPQDEDMTDAISESGQKMGTGLAAFAKGRALKEPVAKSASPVGTQRVGNAKGQMTKEVRPATVGEMTKRWGKKIAGAFPESATSKVSDLIDATKWGINTAGAPVRAVSSFGSAALDKVPKPNIPVPDSVKSVGKWVGKTWVPYLSGAWTGVDLTKDITENILGRDATNTEKVAGAALGGLAGLTRHGQAFGLGYDIANLAGSDELGKKIGEGIGEVIYGDTSQPAFRSMEEFEELTGRKLTDEEKRVHSARLGLPIERPKQETASEDPSGLRAFMGF